MKYTLTEYFAALFDYIFLADFRMQQRDKFDAYYQGNLSVVDYLRRLQDLADTVGDLDDSDVVLAFWCRCQSYLRSELTRAGYEPSELTTASLETLATCIEHVDRVACDTRKGTSSKPNVPRNDLKKQSRSVSTLQAKPAGASTLMAPNRYPSNKSSGFKRPHQDSRDQDKERLQIKCLREEGKYFHCESPDHMAKDCPQRHNKKSPM